MQVNAISVNYKLIDRRSEDLGTPFEDASMKDTVLSPDSMSASIPPINLRMRMQHANLPERQQNLLAKKPDNPDVPDEQSEGHFGEDILSSLFSPKSQ